MYNIIHNLSMEIKKNNDYQNFEEQVIKRINLCDEKIVNVVINFLINEKETIYMLQTNPNFVLSLLDLGISSSNSGLGSFKQMISLLLNQSLYHRAEGFYLGEEVIYTFLEKMMSIPNDKRKLNYNIRRIWHSLDDRLEYYMDVTASFIMALINYYDYLTKEYFGMVPSNWFRINAYQFSCSDLNENELKFYYPTLSDMQLSCIIDIKENLVKQLDEPVQYLLKLK